jgi:hypothetical protein
MRRTLEVRALLTQPGNVNEAIKVIAAVRSISRIVI